MILNYFEESLIGLSKLPAEWRSQASLDELATFLQLNWEQRSVFYDDGQVTSSQQFLEMKGARGIRTNNYIGTIVFKGQQLNIFPKVFRTDSGDNERDELDLHHLMKNLVRWIEYCGKMDYPYISIDSEFEDCNDLRELFITLYVRYVKNALDRGLFYRYEEQTEDCSAIKGKVDFKDYFTRKYPNGQLDKFQCTYSNFEFDNVLNRIIKYTCKGLMSENLSPKNQKAVRHILMKLNDVSDIRCTPHDCDTVRLSRLHRHYSIILSMSKMFLLNKTSSYNVDNNESFCFMFPTEILFEGFIGGFMHHVLHGEAKVTLQASEMSVFEEVEYAGQSYGKALTMRHDILVEHKEKGVFVLDTKYKMLDRFEGNSNFVTIISTKVSTADIYQVLTYAEKRGLKKVYLLYPMFRYEDIEPHPVTGKVHMGDGHSKIQLYLVRLPFIFEDDSNKTAENLRKAIKQIFE